jgi:hypothetical protein
MSFDAAWPFSSKVGSKENRDVVAQGEKTRAMLDRMQPSYEGSVEIRLLDVRDDANEVVGGTAGKRSGCPEETGVCSP